MRREAPPARASSVAQVWGATPEERRQEYPCDRQLAKIDQSLFRAIDVEAPVGVVFRWLCQLRPAPNSYDWIDNFGRKSPRQLILGMEDLAPGQQVMSIFRLAAYEAIAISRWSWTYRARCEPSARWRRPTR